MKMKWKWGMASIALGAAAFGAVLGSTRVDAQQATGRIRVVHMSPDAPAVDILVDGQRAISNLAFKGATEYASLPAGQRDVQVTPAGQNENAVIAAQLPVQAGQDATVVAVGRVANIGALPLPDDNRAPAAGKAKVRFVHASPDAPNVDIAVAGGPVLFANVAFRGVAGYSEVDAGTYSLEVRAAGSQNVALTVPNVALSPGQIVTVFAAGLAADNTLAAVPVVYAAGGQSAGAMPRTGTGGVLDADASLTPWLLGGLAAMALVFAAGTRTLAAVRRRK